MRSMWRGFRRRCPACGKGPLYRRYICVRERCPDCGEALYHHRADDSAPYLALFLVAHAVVPLAFLAALWWALPAWAHLALWLPLGLAMTLAVLPSVKGAMVGLQWALRMHGFEYEFRCAAGPDSRKPANPDRVALSDPIRNPDRSPA
ncbi:MAG: DUF983 domain-containing protein [Hyphomicrobiales bacterium]